ncbi:hypothetical protein OHA01_12135 [Micromonospora zamorensis]|uniref:hypothetical protein n=1 Tax=Micromonospora zamorensis TaxID=709883 RepID=UPI00081F9344|nr:hypothetical protein OHA01_12135 [Micromonospora zamorensis]SCG44708.1 hypothetical protein GA0070619_1594 [Micromonospora zamorensis]
MTSSGELRTRELRSPEQPYKVGLLLVLAVASAASVVTAEGAPDKALGVGAGIVLVLLAWRAAVVRVSITDSSVTDVRLFVRRTYERTEVAEVHLGRPGGFLEGHCLVLTLRDGREAPLTASRVYSWFPIAVHVIRLRELLADVRRWQEQAGSR